MQTQEYVSRFEPLLYVPAFSQKDFHYVHTRLSIKRPPLSNYNLTSTVHNSSLKHYHFYTIGKAQNQSKEKVYNLVIQWSQTLLVISKDHKQFFSQK